MKFTKVAIVTDPQVTSSSNAFSILLCVLVESLLCDCVLFAAHG